MHYKASGYNIRSENAAKPAGQASHYLLGVIKQYEPFKHVLDYGCGKLRYATPLAENAESLTVVDSDIQVDRVQIVCGERTTIRKYVAANWPHATAMNVEEFQKSKRKFDFALCANVLSAIPRRQSRIEVIRQIAARL